MTTIEIYPLLSALNALLKYGVEKSFCDNVTFKIYAYIPRALRTSRTNRHPAIVVHIPNLEESYAEQVLIPWVQAWSVVSRELEVRTLFEYNCLSVVIMITEQERRNITNVEGFHLRSVYYPIDVHRWLEINDHYRSLSSDFANRAMEKLNHEGMIRTVFVVV